MANKLLTIEQHRKRFESDAAAARDLECDYITYRRWLGRKMYAPARSAWRALCETRGIELPRRKASRSEAT